MQINSEVSTQILEHKYSRSTIRFSFDSGKGNQTKITPARYCTQIAVLIIVDIYNAHFWPYAITDNKWQGNFWKKEYLEFAEMFSSQLFVNLNPML